MNKSPAGAAAMDWLELRERLAATARAAVQTASDDRVETILEERARRLALEDEMESVASQAPDSVLFSAAGARYALACRHVAGISRAAVVTPVPGTPERLAGIVHIDGAVVGVFRLAALFAPGAADRAGVQGSGQEMLVLCGEGRSEVALLVDEVRALADLSALPLSAPTGIEAARARCWRGVTADGTVLLDGDALLADPRLTVSLD